MREKGSRHVSEDNAKPPTENAVRLEVGEWLAVQREAVRKQFASTDDAEKRDGGLSGYLFAGRHLHGNSLAELMMRCRREASDSYHLATLGTPSQRKQKSAAYWRARSEALHNAADEIAHRRDEHPDMIETINPVIAGAIASTPPDKMPITTAVRDGAPVTRSMLPAIHAELAAAEERDTDTPARDLVTADPVLRQARLGSTHVYGPIVTERRGDDWIAYITDQPGVWEAGTTEGNAMLKLVTNNPDKLTIVYNG